MKLLRLNIIAIVFLLFLAGCTKNSPTSPNQETSNNGSISLAFDKTNAPQNVVNIIAYLTRTNYDTLKGNLNLLSTSSADIKINDIPVGTWHLKINALNADSAVVYSGETDIQINDGIVTRVNLTLTPTGKGTGSIYIFVDWGAAQSSWIDYQNNPIFNSSELNYFSYSVDQAKILYDNGIYKMWFMNLYNSGKGDVSYAESNDGISWHLVGSAPVLLPGQSGTWDDYTVGTGDVLKEGNIYKMYYAGMRNPNNGARQIGLATSSDGIHWQKYSQPVVTSTPDQYFLGIHSVIKVNGVYYMYYSASPKNSYVFNINLATSQDGINWTKYSGNPILKPTQVWEQGSIGYATVIKDSSGYTMTYSNGKDGIGLAYSNDGLSWTKDSQNPIFASQDAANNWCTKVNYPYSFKVGNEFRIYYSGLGSDGWYHLGVLLKR